MKIYGLCTRSVFKVLKMCPIIERVTHLISVLEMSEVLGTMCLICVSTYTFHARSVNVYKRELTKVIRSSSNQRCLEVYL